MTDVTFQIVRLGRRFFEIATVLHQSPDDAGKFVICGDHRKTITFASVTMKDAFEIMVFFAHRDADILYRPTQEWLYLSPYDVQISAERRIKTTLRFAFSTLYLIRLTYYQLSHRATYLCGTGTQASQTH